MDFDTEGVVGGGCEGEGAGRRVEAEEGAEGRMVNLEFVEGFWRFSSFGVQKSS